MLILLAGLVGVPCSSALSGHYTTAMESLQDWWARLRSFLPPTKRKGFDTLFSLIAWELWKERNARVFRNAAAPVPQLVQTIRHFGEQWVLAGAKKLGCLFSE